LRWRLLRTTLGRVMRRLCVSYLVMLVLGLPGCDRDGGKAECKRVQDQAREAASAGELERASKLVAQARAVCGNEAKYDIERIQGVIDTRQRALDERAALKASAKAAAEQLPVRRLLEWVKLGVVSPELAGLKCAARTAPDYGFCQGHRKGDPAMVVRYWDNDHDASRFTYTSELPLTCIDAGEHRAVRSWSRGDTSYQVCELLQHEVRGLSALLERTPKHSTIYVYSQAYVRRDDAFASLVAGKR
jgi:hypothetical protein